MCDHECKVMNVYFYDPESKAPYFLWTYEVFPRSLLDVIGPLLAKGRFPFTLHDENSIKGTRVANPPRPLEWVASGGVDLYFLWGIDCCSWTCKVSLKAPLTLGGGSSYCSWMCIVSLVASMTFVMCGLCYGDFIVVVGRAKRLQHHPWLWCIGLRSHHPYMWLVVTMHNHKEIIVLENIVFDL